MSFARAILAPWNSRLKHIAPPDLRVQSAAKFDHRLGPPSIMPVKAGVCNGPTRPFRLRTETPSLWPSLPARTQTSACRAARNF